MKTQDIKLISPLAKGEFRTLEQLREHYEVERELADRLRQARREDRSKLYGEVYDELFRRVSHHPQLTLKQDEAGRQRDVAWQRSLLKPLLKPSMTFLEFGAGDCALSLSVCPFVKQVYAVDVSKVIAENQNTPGNFSLILLSANQVPLPAESVDLAYSNQLFEHLHPEDAAEHLKDMYRLLKPGGAYMCVTPNRISGPWDISRYFDTEATGFHLKEYTVGELVRRFTEIGFRRVHCFLGARHWYVSCPPGPVRALEAVLSSLPFSIRSRLARSLPGRASLGIRIIGYK